jgi:YjbE family integral membrane protein
MELWRFLVKGLSIILIDLVLAGDNALVIAMAVRSLPPRERRIGSACGAGMAVVMRVALTFVAAKVLTVPYLKLAGGLLILWIAWKVLCDAAEPPEAMPVQRRLLQAIWYVAAADLTMSTDNILAIAGASNGHLGLIIFGLVVSIPFVVVSSNLLALLMDRFPITIFLGVAVLGKVGGDMIMTDPAVVRLANPADWIRYAVNAGLILALLAAGQVRRKRCAR